MAAVSQSPSPFLRAALTLLGEGATEDDLAARLAEIGLVPRDDTARDLLDQAAALGLVRVASTPGGQPRYVLTSLGQRLIAAHDLPADEATRLLELEALRTDLSATIAHELRTPLTAIRTCAGLLLSEDARPTPEQHRALVETIERNAERMQRVVGDILDLARFRSGSISLQLRRFDAVPMAEAVIRSLEHVAGQRGVRFTLRTGARTVHLFGDHRRIEQALVNLVSNAQRFSPDGAEVELDIRTDGDWVRMAVRDRGPGIPPEEQPRLFERFFVGRADRGGTRDGVGLGLPTALAIAQAHGGRIEVDSRPGEGSTFSLVLPAAGPDDAAANA